MFYIYAFVNKLNNKVYIGKTNNLDKRYGQHIYNSNKSEFAIHKAIRKYGKDNFEFIKIDEDKDEDFVYKLEEYYIKLFASNIIGYNLNSGGLKAKHTKESIAKISNKRKGFKFSEEAILKMKKTHKENPNYSARKLILEQAIEIKQLYNLDYNNFNEKEICKKYNIGIQCLRNLLDNKTYKDTNIITNRIIEDKVKVISNRKDCSLCKANKPITEFYRNKNLICGYDSVCKKCNGNFCKIRKEKIFIKLKENSDLYEMNRLYSIGVSIKDLSDLFNISQVLLRKLMFNN